MTYEKVTLTRKKNTITGMIKSDSPAPRATDFWGRASEILQLARPRTCVLCLSTLSKADVFQASKNQYLATEYTETGSLVACVLSIDILECNELSINTLDNHLLDKRINIQRFNEVK